MNDLQEILFHLMSFAIGLFGVYVIKLNLQINALKDEVNYWIEQSERTTNT